MAGDTIQLQAPTPRTEITLEVAQPGIRGMLSISPDARCFNLDRAGVRFGCTRRFKPGQRLIVDVHAFDIVINELTAVVTDHEQLEDGTWCCEARFCFEDKHMKRPQIFHQLLQIETRLQTNDKYPWSAS